MTQLNHSSKYYDVVDIESIEKSEIKNLLTPNDFAAIYARKSNPQYSHSISTQIELGKKRMDELGLLSYKIYQDEVSATEKANKERKQFEQLKTDIKLGKFKTLIVYKRDRLSRKVDELLELRAFFKKHDVKVYYSDKNEIVLDADNCWAEFIDNIGISVSQFEPGMIDERTSIGKKRKHERQEYSHGKIVPFGYKAIFSNEKVTHYEPDIKTSCLIENLYYAYINDDDVAEVNQVLKKLEEHRSKKT